MTICLSLGIEDELLIGSRGSAPKELGPYSPECGRLMPDRITPEVLTSKDDFK
jgi:hypothetical protein